MIAFNEDGGAPAPEENVPKLVTIKLELDARVAGLLAVLRTDAKVKQVILELIDHAQQGVYRPGSWERVWLSQVFYDDWESKLVPGCPYGQKGYEGVFQKPKKAGDK